MSPSTISRPWMARPALNVFVSKSVWLGCGCQNDGQHLGIEPMRIARLRADAVANALPVVFRRRRNPVSVVAEANLVGGLKLTQCLLHGGKLGVGGDTGVERRRNVLRRAVNALHVLQQANHLGDRLRQRMFKLLRDGGDLRAHLRANVALDEIVDLIESGHEADGLVREIYGGVDEQLLRQLDDGAVRTADMLARAALRAKP